VEGPSSSRQVRLLQFDPNGNIFTIIGDASRVLRLNSKGNWAVWVDGDENAWVDRQINVYSIDANTNYVITSGHSDNVFAGWADNFATVVDCIKKGKEYYFQKNYSAAITEYQNAINADPRNDFAYGLMGYSYYRNGQDDNAVLTLKKSLDINPYNLMSYYNLALVYWKTGDADQAIQALKQIYIYDFGYRKRIYDDPQFKKIIADPKYLQMEKSFLDR
jgi:tetratricopeptide (TPR) repeat protein